MEPKPSRPHAFRPWAPAALGVALMWLHVEFFCGSEERSGVVTLALSALANLEWLLVIGGGAALGWLHSRLNPATARRAAPCFFVVALGAAWFWVGGNDGGLGGGAWATALERARAALDAGAILAGALAAGAWLAGRVLPPPAVVGEAASQGETAAPARLLFAAGLGLGAYALAALALLTVLGRHVGAAALALVALSLLVGGRAALRGLSAAWGRAAAALGRAGGGGWAVAGALAAGLVLLSRFCWLPTLDYDVLEYHALLPRDCLLAGRAVFQPFNMFSAFPQNSEMLTLLALACPLGAGLGAGAGGAPGAGALFAAQLLNFAFLPLTLAALAWLVARLSPARLPDDGAGEGADGETGAGAGAVGALAAALAALAVLAMPGVLQWSPVLYVENGFAFYFLLAVMAALRAVAESPGGSWGRWAALAGVFAGLCAGTKYTGLLFAGAAGGAVLLLCARGWRARLGGAALCGAFCWLLLAPWLVKNALMTGNPFYPLWNLAFGVEGWDAAQETRFYLAHRPGWGMAAAARAAAFSLGEGGRQFLRLFLGLGNVSFGPLAFAGAAGWLLAARGKGARGGAGVAHGDDAAPGGARAVVALALWLALLFLLWFLFTHRLERFFHVGLLLAAVLGGAGAGRLFAAPARAPGRLFAVAAALGAGLWLTALLGNFAEQEIGGMRVGDVVGGEKTGEEWLRANYRYARLRDACAKLAAGGAPAQVLLVGPADVFYLPPALCRWASVFDRHPFLDAVAQAGSPRDLSARLRASGVTHVYFHWREWWRLQSTYHLAYALPPEKQRLLAEFLRTELRTVWQTPSLAPEWQNACAAANPALFPGGAVPVDLFGVLPPGP